MYGHRDLTLDDGALYYCLDEDQSQAYLDFETNDDIIWFNNTISSWWCGKGVKYDFCKNNHTGACDGMNLNGTFGAGNIRSTVTGLEDNITSVFLYSYDPMVQAAITTFDGSSCTGQSGRFDVPTVYGPMNNFIKNDLLRNGAGHGGIRSVSIPYGAAVDFYNCDSFTCDDMVTVTGQPWVSSTT